MPKYAAWNRRFSMTFRLRSGFGRCGTTPMRWRTLHRVGRRHPRRRRARCPTSARTRVVRMPIVVVFPAPFGPSRPKNSPSCTSRSRPFERDDLAARRARRRRRPWRSRPSAPAGPPRAAPLRRGRRGIDLSQTRGFRCAGMDRPSLAISVDHRADDAADHSGCAESAASPRSRRVRPCAAARMRSARRENGSVCSMTRPGPRSRAKNKSFAAEQRRLDAGHHFDVVVDCSAPSRR